MQRPSSAAFDGAAKHSLLDTLCYRFFVLWVKLHAHHVCSEILCGWPTQNLFPALGGHVNFGASSCRCDGILSFFYGCSSYPTWKVPEHCRRAGCGDNNGFLGFFILLLNFFMKKSCSRRYQLLRKVLDHLGFRFRRFCLVLDFAGEAGQRGMAPRRSMKMMVWRRFWIYSRALCQILLVLLHSAAS